MSAAHTPGPWRLNNFGERPQSINGVNGAVPICSFNTKLYDRDRPQARANARLIAAAPELLDALNGLYGLLQLFAARSDVPSEVKNFTTNHRAVDALAVLAKVES